MQERTIRKEYYDNRLTQKQIADKYGVCTSTIINYFKKYDIRPLEPYERLECQNLTDEQMEFMIGTMLGDGSLEVTHTSTNARLRVEHSIKQEELVKYKYNIMKSFTSGPIFYRTRSRLGHESVMCGFRTKCHPLLTDLYNMFYDKGVKVVTNEVADAITPMSLAVWIMDDGSTHGNCTILCTHSFTYPELLRLQKILLDKFKLNTTLPSVGYKRGSNQKNHIIHIRKNSMDDLVEIVSPYMIPSMLYKINL